jgi:hypothetical protein
MRAATTTATHRYPGCPIVVRSRLTANSATQPNPLRNREGETKTPQSTKRKAPHQTHRRRGGKHDDTIADELRPSQQRIGREGQSRHHCRLAHAGAPITQKREGRNDGSIDDAAAGLTYPGNGRKGQRRHHSRRGPKSQPDHRRYCGRRRS